MGVLNQLGQYVDDFTGPIIQHPIERILAKYAPGIKNEMGMMSATNAAGSTIGGLLGGLVGGGVAAGGMGLAEMLRNSNERKREDELVAKLLEELQKR